MKHVLRLADQSAEHLLLLTVPESLVARSSIDVIFDLLAEADADELVAANIMAAGQVDDLTALRMLVFDKDGQGFFIRDGVSFTSNGKELEPDMPIEGAFVMAELDGVKYWRCDLLVSSANGAVRKIPQQNPIETLAKVFFIHQIAFGPALDLTKEYPELESVLQWGLKEDFIEIDVEKAAYILTNKGKRLHESYIAEAQALIKKYDIYGDVDLDENGKARFDTNLGKDLRVPVYELEGIDPFRARFLIGLSDGEWDGLSNWPEVLHDEQWYKSMFEPIERAPSLENIGKERLLSVIDQAKTLLRQDYRLRDEG